MRIAIVITSNLYRAPYLNYYINFLDFHNVGYDIISWNRNLVDESGTIAFNFKQSEEIGYLYRFYSYFEFRKFVVNHLDSGKYDLVIVSTIAIGILIRRYLKCNYDKKYIFDVRDHSVFRKLSRRSFRKLIKHSFGTVVSSEGFKNWLPQNPNYFISHNYPFNLSRGKVVAPKEIKNINKKIDSINISTIGSLRDFDANTFLIKELAKHDEFQISFFGSGPAYEPLRKFVRERDFKRVSFFGRYEKENEVNLLHNTDFINNFTNFDLNSRTLVTNRFYLSVVLGIPMIVRAGTYQAELCSLYNLGCIVATDCDVKKQLISYIYSFEIKDYNKGRADFLRIVEVDTGNLEAFLMDFIKSGRDS